MHRISIWIISLFLVGISAYFLRDGVSDTLLVLASKQTEKSQSGALEPKNPSHAIENLERATQVFFRKNIDQIATNLALQNASDSSKQEAYKKDFEQFQRKNIKADISFETASILRKELLSQESINPKDPLFRAYVHVMGRLQGKTKSASGATKLDGGTMKLILLAERWVLPPDTMLDSETLQAVFESAEFIPWRELDLRTMRRTIVTEWLSQESLYTRAYLTASHLFGRKSLGNRLYLKNTLKHTKQFASLSCEANSATHFYNYYAGKSKAPLMKEPDMFELFPKDERLPQLTKISGGFQRIWGDPETAFVWNVSGKQSINIRELTGYGIHAAGVVPVLQKLLQPLQYSVKTTKFNEMTIVWNLSQNHPILFWYVFSEDPKQGFAKLEWKTWAGEPRTGYIGEHTGIIVGAELSRSGELTKVAYYEGLSDALIWEDWNSLKRKARFFNESIVVSGKKR